MRDLLPCYIWRTTSRQNYSLEKLLTSSQNEAYLNCDDPVIVRQLQNQSLNNLQRLLSNTDLVVIDEAQRVENIGLTAKLIHDNLPNIKLLLTGSSSLDLANKTKEPLTGRSVELLLYPSDSKKCQKNLLSGNNKREITDTWWVSWVVGHEPRRLS